MTAATWVVRRNPFDDDGGLILGAARSDDVMIAAGTNNSSTINVIWSPNGIAWVAATTPLDPLFVGASTGAAWSPDLGLFAVTAASSQGYIITSPDGQTWTLCTLPAVTADSWELDQVVWADALGLFVAAGWKDISGTHTLVVMTSPDGVAWTDEGVSTTISDVRSLTWSPTLELLLLGVTMPSPSDCLFTSDDASTWTPQSSPIPQRCQAVGWFPRHTLFVAGDLQGGISTSPDGIAWTSRFTDASSTKAFGVADNGDMLAAISTYPTNDVDMVRSVTGLSWVTEDNAIAPSSNPVLNAFSLTPDGESVMAAGTNAVGGSSHRTMELGSSSTPQTQYQRIYGWTVRISDDALETVDPLLTSPET